MWSVLSRPGNLRGGFGLETKEIKRCVEIIENSFYWVPDNAEAYSKIY